MGMRRGWSRSAHAVPMHEARQDGLAARLLVVQCESRTEGGTDACSRAGASVRVSR
jgi:hypothetical protein